MQIAGDIYTPKGEGGKRWKGNEMIKELYVLMDS